MTRNTATFCPTFCMYARRRENKKHKKERGNFRSFYKHTFIDTTANEFVHNSLSDTLEMTPFQILNPYGEMIFQSNGCIPTMLMRRPKFYVKVTYSLGMSYS